MARSIDYSIRWHLKFQLEELAKDIATIGKEEKLSLQSPETILALGIVTRAIQKRADDIIL